MKSVSAWLLRENSRLSQKGNYFPKWAPFWRYERHFRFQNYHFLRSYCINLSGHKRWSMKNRHFFGFKHSFSPICVILTLFAPLPVSGFSTMTLCNFGIWPKLSTLAIYSRKIEFLQLLMGYWVLDDRPEVVFWLVALTPLASPKIFF